MALRHGDMLGKQGTWDLLRERNAHARPQDFRFAGAVAQTREKYQASSMSRDEIRAHGRRLGAEPAGR